MAYINSPQEGKRLEGEPLPRLLQIGEDVLVFEGQDKPGQYQMEGFYREDQLVLKQLAGIAAQVSWHNRSGNGATGQNFADPFNMLPEQTRYWRSKHIFTAQVHLTDEMFETLWLQEEGRFMQSSKSANRQQKPQVEHAHLVVIELARIIKLEVATPIGTYKAGPESLVANPITFNKFQPYGWEFFSASAPVAKHLFVPDEAEVDVLQARFIIETPFFKRDFAGPPSDVVPARPLVGV